jgi:predicted nucleotidyltransferase component of viral defense system
MATERNLGASIQARLRLLARERGDDVQLLLTRFVLERLLHRLVTSGHGGSFVLKGASLFSIWTASPHRSTRDLDLLGHGASDVNQMRSMFRDVASTVVDPDGVCFDAESVRADPIREGQPYEGIRITISATIGNARLPAQVDVGFGDAVYPAPRELHYPSLLGLPTPRILAYPPEAVVAEKFQAMVSLGEINSRMKDFFDVHELAKRFDFDGEPLARSLRVTFERRMTDIPDQLPIALRNDFALLAGKQAQWAAFVRRGRLLEPAIDLAEVVATLRTFLWPIVEGLHGGPQPQQWPPGGPWKV